MEAAGASSSSSRFGACNFFFFFFFWFIKKRVQPVRWVAPVCCTAGACLFFFPPFAEPSSSATFWFVHRMDDAVGAERKLEFFFNKNPEVEISKNRKIKRERGWNFLVMARWNGWAFIHARARFFLGFIEMLDRSSALNRAWKNASVDYTKRFKRNRAGKRGRTDTFSISLSPLPAIHSSRRWKLIDAGAMYVCVLLLPAAIITVLYITQMLLLLDGDTLRVALLLQLDRCNQFLQLLFHHTFGWCNWSPVLPSSTVARPSAYFKTCQTFFGEENLCAGTLLWRMTTSSGSK